MLCAANTGCVLFIEFFSLVAIETTEPPIELISKLKGKTAESDTSQEIVLAGNRRMRDHLVGDKCHSLPTQPASV